MAIVNAAAINIDVQVPILHPDFMPLDTYPQVVLLDHMAVLFSVLLCFGSLLGLGFELRGSCLYSKCSMLQL
jgi:hypothetical protein